MYEKLAVQSPCSADWQSMSGSEKVRHCEKCRFNVYDFSQMTRDEIVAVLGEGKVCGRLFIRQDGTYVTKDCQKKLKRKKQLKYAGLAAVISLFCLPFLGTKEKFQNSSFIDSLRDVPLVGKLVNHFYPKPVLLMGLVCPPGKGGPVGNPVGDEDDPFASEE